MHVSGFVLFLFRNANDKQTIYLKQFETPTLFDVREVLGSDAKEEEAMKCQHDYLNSTTHLNMTMKFESATLEVTVNGKPCLQYKILETVFGTAKATTAFFGYSSEQAPLSIRVNEISIYKMSRLMSKDELHFVGSVAGLMNSIQSYDQAHFQNASLSNLLLADVS
jgi:hypothetical protein